LDRLEHFAFAILLLLVALWTATWSWELLDFLWYAQGHLWYLHPTVTAAAVALVSVSILARPRPVLLCSIALRDESLASRSKPHAGRFHPEGVIGVLVALSCLLLAWRWTPTLLLVLFVMAAAGVLCAVLLVGARRRQALSSDRPWWRNRPSEIDVQPSTASRFLPHPSRPGSLVTFVALPVLLGVLLHLALQLLIFFGQPGLPDYAYEYLKDDVANPESRSQLAALLESRVGKGTTRQRGMTLRALALLTGECPGYAARTVPLLVTFLQDPDRHNRIWTAHNLAALGPTARPALPALRRAHGSTDAHFDHLLLEAIWWIEHGSPTGSSTECEPLSKPPEEAR
jgi:hypothetical protein